MATGRLGAAAPGATTWTLAYDCPINTFSVVTVSIANRGASAMTVRLALTTTAPPSVPANSEFLEFDTTIIANGVLERTGIVMDRAQARYLAVFASNANASVVVYGIETSTA